MVQAQIHNTLTLLRKAAVVVAFTGAGISTPSGIPDFRSSGSGMWDQVDPMSVGSIFGFRQNPQAFYDWVRPLAALTISAEPNSAHLALKKMEAMNKLQTIITQNIDMLHSRAGNQTIHELHGHLREATCTQCFTVYDGQPILEQFIEDGNIPRCDKCKGVLKPNVILFGEQLPYRALQAAKEAALACDLMLVLGSSLEVFPASELPMLANRAGAALIIINEQPTPLDHMADVVIHADLADVLPRMVEGLEVAS